MKTDTRQRILDFIKRKKQTPPKEIIAYIGLGAPAVFRQLKKLQERGEVQKTGKPPKVFYHLPMDKGKSDNAENAVSLTIHVKNYGKTLTSYHEAEWLCSKTRQLLRQMNAKKISKITIDFSGVMVLSSDWADRFVSPLANEFQGLVELLPGKNASVRTSLSFVIKKLKK